MSDDIRFVHSINSIIPKAKNDDYSYSDIMKLVSHISSMNNRIINGPKDMSIKSDMCTHRKFLGVILDVTRPEHILKKIMDFMDFRLEALATQHLHSQYFKMQQHVTCRSKPLRAHVALNDFSFVFVPSYITAFCICDRATEMLSGSSLPRVDAETPQVMLGNQLSQSQAPVRINLSTVQHLACAGSCTL